MKAKSSFTRQIEKAHDQAPNEVYGGGTFTAVEAEKGLRRVSNSLQRAAHNKHASPLKQPVNGDGRDGILNEAGVTRHTSLVQNRTRCIGENEQADRLSFEDRVQEIMGMKNTGNVLNARVIETWINETLADAEHLEIPGVILKPT